MGQTVRFQATWIAGVTLRDLREGTRYVWHEGGSRSGKTYNIAAALCMFAAETGYTIDVVRASFPTLFGTAYQDLVEVLRGLGLYDPAGHSRAPGNHQITLRGGRGTFRLYSVDDEQKVRGRSRDVLWMNEANEISDEKRRQLWMRTRRHVVVDHNPTVDESHWIIKLLEATPEYARRTRYYKSTYKDNPFLPAEQVREIEAMQYADPYGWRVYGLGERGANPAAVFTDLHLGPFAPPGGHTVYGVDFGFHDPFVVVEAGWQDANPPHRPKATLYVRPLVYATNITTGDAIEMLKAHGADRRKPMWCDAAEPDRIAELRRAGFDAKAAKKRPGMREAGYGWLRRHRIIVDEASELASEVRLELGRTRHRANPDGTFSDTVLDRDDHVGDALRYGAFTRWGRTRKSTYSFSSMRS